MTPAQIDKFVARVDGKDHAERLASVASYALGVEDAGPFIDGLWAGDTYRRRMALIAAEARRDVERMRRGLTDPSLSVRVHAAGLVGRYAPSIPADWLDGLDPTATQRLLSQVVRRERRSVAGALLPALLAQGRIDEAALLLPVCPAGQQAELLDTVAWPAEVWPRLARHATELMADRVTQAFAATDRPDLVWSRYDGSVWRAFAERRPIALAGWIDDYADPVRLPW